MTPIGTSANTPNPIGTQASSTLGKKPVGSYTAPKDVPDLPYLSQEVDKNGEPFYGGGFTGWARRAHAAVYDPRFLTSGMDEKQKANYLAKIPKYENLINKVTLWDSWAGQILGISAKNLAEVGAAVSAETDAGDRVAQATGVVRRGVTPAFFGAAGLLQGLEYTVRQIGAASKSLEEFANTTTIKDKDLNPFGNKFWNGKILQNFDAYASYFPGLLDVGYDIYRIMEGNPDWDKSDEIFKKHWRSASAVYSMAWNPMLAAEFERRFQSGEDPYKIAYEIQNPWVEITAGILLDPTTYMGIGLPGKFGKASQAFKLADKIPFGSAISRGVPFMKKTLFNIPWEVVYRTPEFGEIIGLSKFVGKGKISARALSKTEAMPELKSLLNTLHVNGTSDEAIQNILLKNDKLIEAAQKRAQGLMDVKRPYGIMSLRAQDRYYSLATRAQNFDSWVLGAVKGNYDEALKIYSDLRAFIKGTADERNTAFMSLTRRGFGEALLSEEAFEMAHLVDRLYADGKIVEMAKGKNAVENMLLHMTKVLDDIAPTVTEMRKASKMTADELAKLSPEELAKTQRLAETYKGISPVVKGIERLSSAVNKGYNPIMRYQGMVFFTLSPMYPLKNAFGNFAPMVADLGADAAIKTLAETGAAWTGEKAVDFLLNSKHQRIKDAIGYLPSKTDVAFIRSTGGQVSAKNKLFASISERVERIFSASIVENVVLDGMRKILRNAIFPAMKPQFDEVAALTNQETAGLLAKLIDDNHGNLDKALVEFAEATKEGFVETWRHQDPEVNLQILLRKVGGEDTFRDMLKAKTPEELLAKKEELLKAFREKGDLAGLEKPVGTLSPEDADIAAELGDDIGVDFFKGSLNAWRTAITNMDTVIGHYMSKLGELTNKGLIPKQVHDAEIAEINRIKNVFDSDTIDSLDKFRDFVREEIVARARKGAATSELWNSKFNFKKPMLNPETGEALLEASGAVRYEDNWFSLKEIYPNVPELGLTQGRLIDLAWRAYFPTRTREYTLGKSGLLDAVLNKMRTNQYGINFDEMAAGIGMGERQANPLKEIEKYRQMAIGYAQESEFARLLSTSGATDTALVDYAMRVGLPGGKPETLVNVVNKYNPRTSVPMPLEIEAELKGIDAKLSKPTTPSIKKGYSPNVSKYDSPEKYLKGEYVEMHHYGDAEIGKFDKDRDAWFTSNPTNYPRGKGKVKNTRYVNVSSLNLAKQKDMGPFLGKGRDEIRKGLMELGFDGIKHTVDGDVQYAIFDPDNIRTKDEALRYFDVFGGGADPADISKLQARKKEIDNKYQPGGEATLYKSIDEIPFKEGVKGLDAFAAEHGRRVWAFNPTGEQTPTMARSLYESREYYEASINAVANKALGDWGHIVPTNPIKKQVFDNFRKVYDEKMSSSRLYLGELANEMRDFILHSYEKTYLDLAAGYVLPYQYWQTRTYKKFAERAISDPRILINYKRYKDTLGKLHAGMPDWWKQNIPIYGLPGMDPNEPMFFNLEASLNPVNGITGVDFQDPYKRVNWWTKAVDDMNSFGPSMAMPLNWAMGLALYNQGEKDAAARWMGRLFPQSQAIKSALTLAGVKPTGLTPYNEVDPFTNLMSGGLDPYEQRRVHRSLAAMVNDGSITDEQAYDAAYFKDETWDRAVELSVKGRAPANLASFFLGVGFKPRTQNDMVIDQFYADYSKLVQTKDNLAPEAYKNSMAALRQQYPFMDTLLMSKNYGEERETAFAYGILSRIPPGQSDDLLKMVGINQDSIDRFYDNKGDMEYMTVPERELFMAAVMNMGALLQIPDNATSVDWNRAKTAYSQIYTDAEKMYGADIWTKIDTYYGYLDTDKQLANDYLDSNPDIQEVMTFRQKAIAMNPDVYKYYGSLDTIQRYYDTKLREMIVKEFGEDIYSKFDEYGVLKLTDSKAASRYYKAHPELKAYSKYKREIQDKINKTIVDFAENLPERPNVLLREDIQQPIEVQQQMGEQFNPPKQKTWQDWKKELSPPMQNLVISYFTEGEPLEYAAQEQLDYMAEKMGMSGDELLQQIGMSLFESSGMAQANPIGNP